jgi:hypothetical protein
VRGSARASRRLGGVSSLGPFGDSGGSPRSASWPAVYQRTGARKLSKHTLHMQRRCYSSSLKVLIAPFPELQCAGPGGTGGKCRGRGDVGRGRGSSDDNRQNSQFFPLRGIRHSTFTLPHITLFSISTPVPLRVPRAACLSRERWSEGSPLRRMARTTLRARQPRRRTSLPAPASPVSGMNRT